MALQKGGVKPNEAIVVENAPMGVQAGVAAGIFTIAVNTGPINGQVDIFGKEENHFSSSAIFFFKFNFMISSGFNSNSIRTLAVGTL